ncbi:hypothetical protein L1987_33316 [Smallanthus sonchifolius]|uniref:Uncharacterized protein n=1 Tax=Smallanthus sonchifolius TaxID=185202 RepID=A0ACB9HQR4_9ASTR|nr:hypothetical protein L1987_33316 [Smallanthus sonchifolius]
MEDDLEGEIIELKTMVEISWDDLFDYSGFHAEVGGEGSSGFNENVQGSFVLKDKEPLDVVDEEDEGEKYGDEDVEGGDKDEEPKNKDDNDQGGNESYVQEGKGGKPLYETANGKTVENDDDMEDTDTPRSVMVTNFHKWHYDIQTGEAVIQIHDAESIRVFDLLHMSMFNTTDLNVLFAHPVNLGPGNATRDDATMYMRMVTTAMKMRAHIMTLKKRIQED